METRRRIALITSELENVYQQRVMKGMFSQCAKYGYDVAVFATMVDTAHSMKENLKGELNIFELVNFDLFDGVIITPDPLFAMDDGTLKKAMLEMFREKCHSKVVALDVPFGDHEVVSTDDAGAFYEITRHIYEEHHKQKVYFLTGFQDYDISQKRLEGFLRYTSEHGIQVPEDHIFYGDYWYTSGEKLADDIDSGRVELPDAVICASDHMAIGLVNRLTAHGISVPGQIAVTGYDATQEAAFNDIYISSYEPKVCETAAEAVNRIRRAIEPEAECLDTAMSENDVGLRTGESCGCAPDMAYWKKCIDNALLHQKTNWTDYLDKPIDVGMLMNSYMLEQITSAPDYMTCLDRIYSVVYLLHPYGDFWLCMKENWLDINHVMTQGYPDRMRVFLHSQGAIDMEPAKSIGFSDEIGPRSFDTGQMLPELCEEHEPSVFYFLPIHAGEVMYGYAVVRNPLLQKYLVGPLYRHWIRFVSNALSMTRIRNQLFELSMKDPATGLYNRRGMREWLMGKKGAGGKVFCILADMDGLKYINDKFGHGDGDFSLQAIADALKENVGWNEIGARIGGDEFLLVGVGQYTPEDVKAKLAQIKRSVAQKSENSGKEYEISVSLGFALGDPETYEEIDRLVEGADALMYEDKRSKYRNRNERAGV
ncbi:MAG: GGDEF domain-containing protein [Firmicutes bacterium]|nr:GGDEF domain-containing protein [Bacillota bacterium]